MNATEVPAYTGLLAALSEIHRLSREPGDHTAAINQVADAALCGRPWDQAVVPMSTVPSAIERKLASAFATRWYSGGDNPVLSEAVAETLASHRAATAEPLQAQLDHQRQLTRDLAHELRCHLRLTSRDPEIEALLARVT